MKFKALQSEPLTCGVLPDTAVSLVKVDWHGPDAPTRVDRGPKGRIAEKTLYRHEEVRLEFVGAGRLGKQWQEMGGRRFHLAFGILVNDTLEAARIGKWIQENDLALSA